MTKVRNEVETPHRHRLLDYLDDVVGVYSKRDSMVDAFFTRGRIRACECMAVYEFIPHDKKLRPVEACRLAPGQLKEGGLYG